MDGLRWTNVLLQWVKGSKLVSCEHENIEQCSVNDFYQQFRERMQTTLAVAETNVIDFLKEHFPHYELYLTETGQIAAPDHFYIFSLLLYFSCVRHPERFFQSICNGFDKPKQYAVTGFLKSMHEGNHLRKEIDRMMIRKAIQDAMPKAMLPPSPPQSNLQQQSQSSRLTASSDVPDSPLRLNSRLARISPPTPKTIILDERTKQLKELKAQLEAERYEKGYLEVQLKQLQDKNDKFLEDKRKHLKEIRELKAELLTCNRENESPNKQRGADHKLVRIERQLAEKEAALDQLRIELETVSENNKNATEMINYRNSQIVKLKDKILEQEASIVTLSECVEEKELMIKYLRESNDDLQNFIKENRLERENAAAATDTLNTSFECLELSSAASTVGSSGGGTGSKNYSPENMATVVVDVQLKEKEAENCLLKRSLDAIEQEKVRVSGLVGQFFRLYADIVGSLPEGVENPNEVGFVDKMNIFKHCYETLFEEFGKFQESKGALESQNEVLEENVRQLKTEVIAISGVLRNLESHSAELEKEMAIAKHSANEYQQRNAAMEEELRKQKVDFLKLIAEKDSLQKCYEQAEQERESLSQQSLTMNVELNSLKGDHESIMRQIDYLMISINEDYEGSDFSSWFEKMDDLKDRLSSLKQDKEQLTALNMRIMVEKIALEKEISNGEIARQLLLHEQSEANKMISDLKEQTKLLQATLEEKNENILSLEKIKTDLETNAQHSCEELLEAQQMLKKTEEAFKNSQESLQSNSKKMQICEKELVVMKEANTTLYRDLDEQRALVQKLERAQQEHVDRKTQLEKAIEQSRSELNHINEQHDKLVVERNCLREEKLSLEQNCSKQRLESEESTNLIRTLEMRVNDLQELLNKQTEKAERERTEEEQRKLKASTEQQELLLGVNRSLLSGFNLFNENIRQLESQYASKIGTLQERLGQFSALLAKLSAQQYKLRLEKTVIEQNLVQMMEEYEAMQVKNESAENDKKSLQLALVEVQAEKQALAKQRIGTENELAETSSMLQAEKEKVKEIKSQLDALIAENLKANEECTMKESELKHKLHSAENLTEQLRGEIEQGNELRVNLKSLIEAKTEQLQQLSNERDELNGKCTQLEVDLKQVQSDLVSQKQLAAESSSEATQLRVNLESNQVEICRLNAEINRLETDLSQCQEKLTDQQQNVSEKCREKELLEKKINELTTDLAAARESKEQEQEKSEELGCQLEKMQRNMSVAAEELAQRTREREQLLSKQTVLLQEKEELAERVEDMTETIALLEEDRDTLREEKCRLEAEVERIDNEREALGEQCAKLLAELSKERDASADARKTHEEKISDLNRLCGDLERELNASKQHQEELVRDLEQSKNALEYALSSNGSIEKKVSELSQKLEDLRSEKFKLEEEKSILLGEQKTAKETIDGLEVERNQLQEIDAQSKQRIASVEGLNQEIEKKLQDVTNAHKVASEQNQDLNGQIKQLRETITANQTALNEKQLATERIREQLVEAQASLEKKSEEITLSTRQLLKKEEEIQRLRDENEKQLLSHTQLLKKAETEKQSLSTQLEGTKQTILALESKTSQLSLDLENRSADFVNEKKEAEIRAQKISTVLARLASSENKCTELQEQLETLSSIQELAASRTLQLQSEIDTQKAALEDYELLKVRYHELSTCEENLRKQLEQLQSSIHSKDSQLEQLKQEISHLNATNHTLQAAVSAKNTEILQLTEGLEKIKTFQSQLELKVSDFESVVAEKDEMELHSIKLQNEFDLLNTEKLAMASELEKLSEDKLDVEQRLIQQLQEYDKLNEALLDEREQKDALERKQSELLRQMQAVVDDKQRLVENSRSELAAKDKKLLQQEEQMEKLKRNVDEVLGKNQRFNEIEHELIALKTENSELQAAKEKLQEAVEDKEIREKSMQENMEQLKESLKSKQTTIDSLNSDVSNFKQVMHTLKIENSKLKSTHELQQTKLLNFELKNSEQAKKINKLEETLSKTEICHLEDNSKASTLLQELEKYKEYEAKVQQLQELHQKEREINQKCLMDSEILTAKLLKSRKMSEESEQQFNRERLMLLEKVKEANKNAEEKMREIRNEYEGKLEKMKEKMKSLYNEEMQKTNRKHEKDLLDLKAEIQQEAKRFTKMEIHSGKLQQQLSLLNEKNLEIVRENEFMKSKLRVLEEIRMERNSMLPPPAHTRLDKSNSPGSNLKMEDEEGEVFNNTYLTDLKTGRMSPPFAGRDSIRYSELVQRNSMVPPHLRSSYLPQYVDEELTDDDVRDAAAGILDDSSTSLISRKKVGGTTSYKRPGPPTPSKKAGRLSFGGSLPTNDFQYKEIQKDNPNGASTTAAILSSRLSFGGRKSIVDPTTAVGNNSGSGNSMTLAEMNARKKTPGKFKQMFSSSNLLNTLHKDETPTKREIPPTKLQHPAIVKINCDDETDSGSFAAEEKRARFRSKRDATPKRAMKEQRSRQLRKAVVRFDKNRRLSSVDSDSPAVSPRVSGDPYGGFSYDGTPDRIKKIDINSMNVFTKGSDQQPLPSLVVFSGDKKDDNNNRHGLTDDGSALKQEDFNPYVIFEKSDFVHRLCTRRRDKQRRKSRDQRRESFNRLRNINGDAIVYRSMQKDYPSEILVDSSKMFESLLEQKTLDRPSEIFPRGIRARYFDNVLTDPFDQVVSSSTGMHSPGNFPLLERFSEIFRIATLQRTKAITDQQEPSADSGRSTKSDQNNMFVVFVGVVFTALIVSIYFYYFDFRTNTSDR